MSKPIKVEEVHTVYKCPDCNYKSEYEDSVGGHIYQKHTYPSFEKEVKLFGTNCEFVSEEQATRFVKAYAGHRCDWDNIYNSELKWEGPGRYHFVETMTRDFHHQSDLGREYKLTFHRYLFQ